MLTLTAVVRSILKAPLPGSLRALGRAAGVPHSTLSKIKAGTLNASPEVARALAGALDHWTTQSRTAARRLRAALPRERKP
jgi:hypothetical protein